MNLLYFQNRIGFWLMIIKWDMPRNKDPIKFLNIILFTLPIRKGYEYCISFLCHLTLTRYRELMSNGIISSSITNVKSHYLHSQLPICPQVPYPLYWVHGCTYAFCLCIFAPVLAWINMPIFEVQLTSYILYKPLKNTWITDFSFLCLIDKNIKM